MKRPRSLLVAAALGFAAPLPAHADEPAPSPSSASPAAAAAEADLHFRQGVALYKEQSFAAALVEFRKAYSVLPDWHVLYDIGMTELELNDAAGAFTSLDRYLGEASGVSAKRKAEVEARLEALKLQVGTLRVSVNVDGAEVLVDDLSVGKSPLPHPIVVNIGRRRVVASLPDGRQLSRLVDVASQDNVPVDLVIPQPPPVNAGPPLSPPPYAQPEPRPAPLSPSPLPEAAPPVHHADLLWVGYVGTAVLAAGGIVAGALALGAKGTASSDASKFGISMTSLDNANNQKHVLAALADALFASAVVAGGVTFYFALRHSSRPQAPSALSSWSITAGPTGAVLRAAF